MCLYLGVSEELTYVDQEHVFPAGLGGKAMLDKGVVSDQANKRFSKMELKLMRESLLAMDRMLFGPGKRGSLNPIDASKSLVNVAVQDDGKPVLAYTAAGKPYCIPQFSLHNHEVSITAPNEHGDTQTQITEFIDRLQRFEGRFVFLPSKEIPEKEFLLGWFDGKYYVAANGNRPAEDAVQQEINKLVKHFEMKEIQERDDHARQNHRLCETPEIARMYAKVAMNALAWLKGEKYAAHPNFEDIRKWIVTGEAEKDYFSLPHLEVEPKGFAGEIIPSKAHWCVFVQLGTQLGVTVSFYNCYYRNFILGELPAERVFYPDGFICDWKNEKEYTLMQLIDKAVRENHDRIDREK